LLFRIRPFVFFIPHSTLLIRISDKVIQILHTSLGVLPEMSEPGGYTDNHKTVYLVIDKQFCYSMQKHKVGERKITSVYNNSENIILLCYLVRLLHLLIRKSEG